MLGSFLLAEEQNKGATGFSGLPKIRAIILGILSKQHDRRPSPARATIVALIYAKVAVSKSKSHGRSLLCLPSDPDTKRSEKLFKFCLASQRLQVERIRAINGIFFSTTYLTIIISVIYA